MLLAVLYAYLICCSSVFCIHCKLSCFVSHSEVFKLDSRNLLFRSSSPCHHSSSIQTRVKSRGALAISSRNKALISLSFSLAIHLLQAFASPHDTLPPPEWIIEDWLSVGWPLWSEAEVYAPLGRTDRNTCHPECLFFCFLFAHYHQLPDQSSYRSNHVIQNQRFPRNQTTGQNHRSRPWASTNAERSASELSAFWYYNRQLIHSGDRTLRWRLPIIMRSSLSINSSSRTNHPPHNQMHLASADAADMSTMALLQVLLVSQSINGLLLAVLTPLSRDRRMLMWLFHTASNTSPSPNVRELLRTASRKPAKLVL